MEIIGPVLAEGPWHGPPFLGAFPLFLLPLLWLLVLAGIATAIVLVRRRQEALAGARAGERVLAERFAQGEITTEEYRNRLTELRDRG